MHKTCIKFSKQSISPEETSIIRPVNLDDGWIWNFLSRKQPGSHYTKDIRLIPILIMFPIVQIMR